MNNSNSNVLIAALLSMGIIFGWQYFYEQPKLAKHKKIQQQQTVKANQFKKQTKYIELERCDAVNNSPRVAIDSPTIKGSINLIGARIDDISLIKYNKSLHSEEAVELFSPGNCKDAYFAEFGWFNSKTELPDANTLWQADKRVLKAGDSVNLSWVNKDNIEFIISYSLDENYMFNVMQQVKNKGERPIIIQNYGLLNRKHIIDDSRLAAVTHLGPIAVINDTLKEFKYKDVKEKREEFNAVDISWIGFSDKYWLASFIPDNKYNYNSNFSFARDNINNQKFQADFYMEPKIIEIGDEFTVNHKLFAGAKEIKLLDKYAENYDIKLFDRAIDFGWYYVITKPMFNALTFFYELVGNFGVSILIVTIIVKLLLFQLSNKSFKSMKALKKLQPQIERLKEQCGDDKMKLNTEMMNLYKREKVNPVSGCLPILIQIPIFFSLYKVLNVTLEMRHAPFFGWIQDLSAKDPTSIFNLFGLLPYDVPSMLTIGIWPIIMAGTMFLQQKMNPAPSDPMQAKVMQFMPLIFLVVFSSFPAGLVIYWAWNNILSISQQYVINKSNN